MLNGASPRHLYADLYKWNNNTGKFDVTTSLNKDYGTKYSGTKLTERGGDYASKGVKYVTKDTAGVERRLIAPLAGLKAAVLDVNSDGTDDIVFSGFRYNLLEHLQQKVWFDADGWVGTYDQHADYSVRPYLALITFDESDKKLKPTEDYVWEGDAILTRNIPHGTFKLEVWHAGDEYLYSLVARNASYFPVVDREIVLAAGPFFGTSGVLKPLDDVVLRYYGAHMPLFRSNGSTLTRVREIRADDTTAFVTSDFAGEGIELGRPLHLVRTADRSYMAVLQAPPYHVDNIAADGKSLTLAPVNYSYIKGASTTYAKSSNETEKKNVKFDIQNTVETIFALGDKGENVVGGYKKAKAVYGVAKVVAGFIPGVKGYVGAVDGVVSKVTNFLDSCIDKVETIKTGYDSELESVELKSSVSTERLDSVYLAEASQHIWRYPIITKPAPDWSTVGVESSIDAYITKEDFITFTLYDDVQDRVFNSDSSYQPVHENGNLFSYPSAVANIEGYRDKQKELSGVGNVQLGTMTVTNSMTFSKVKEHDETNSKKVTQGFISQGLSIVDNIFNTSLANVPQDENSTFTRTEQAGEQVIFTLPNADASPLNNAYNMQYQAYVAENGAVVCGFAVNNLNRNYNLFNTDSLYGTKPDPSFVLPYKFVLSDYSSALPGFAVNNQRMAAMEMRGIRFYAMDYNMYTSGRLLGGANYRIEIPVYNASFMPVNNLKVRLYYVKDRSEAALANKTLIGDSQAINMPGWANDADNRAWARIEFTPEMADGNYQLYAVIDPDNAIDEVHETRDLAKDPGGNNEGYFDFSVENADTAEYASASMRSAGVRASEEGDGLYFRFRINGKTYDDFFDTEITGTEGPVAANISVTNITDVVIPDIDLAAYYLDVVGDNVTSDVSVLSKKFTLFPNETYNYSFMLDDDMADKFREKGKYLALIVCYTPDDFSIGGMNLKLNLNAVTMAGDANPALEVYTDSGNDDGNNGGNSDGGNGNSGNKVSGSSGGGCDAGFSISGMMIALTLIFRRKH